MSGGGKARIEAGVPNMVTSAPDIPWAPETRHLVKEIVNMKGGGIVAG